MNIGNIQKRWPWRSFALGVLVAVAPPAAVSARAQTSEADALHQQAVSQYIDGATKEMDAYRQQVNAAVRSDNQQRVDDAKSKLEEGDRLVASLKAADSGHFDAVKADYEHNRAELVKALQAEQKA
jgi:hypothetical protein